MGRFFCVDSRIDAQRFSSGSQLWGVLKVPMYGSRFRSIRCPSLNSPIKLSHRQERGCGQVTFYGEIGRLPFMGAISPFGRKTMRLTTLTGTLVWEPTKVASYGRNRGRIAGHHESLRRSLFHSFAPMDGYLRRGKSCAGFRDADGKGSGFWEEFWSKGRRIWGSTQIVESGFFLPYLLLRQDSESDARARTLPRAAKRYKVRSQ